MSRESEVIDWVPGIFWMSGFGANRIWTLPSRLTKTATFLRSRSSRIRFPQSAALNEISRKVWRTLMQNTWSSRESVCVRSTARVVRRQPSGAQYMRQRECQCFEEYSCMRWWPLPVASPTKLAERFTLFTPCPSCVPSLARSLHKSQRQVQTLASSKPIK